VKLAKAELGRPNQKLVNGSKPRKHFVVSVDGLIILRKTTSTSAQIGARKLSSPGAMTCGMSSKMVFP
jgi:hypothetical protein